MCLCSPNSINWYRRKLVAKQALHAAHYSPVSVDLHLRLVSGLGLQKRRSAPPYGHLWLGKDFSFLASNDVAMVDCICDCVRCILIQQSPMPKSLCVVAQLPSNFASLAVSCQISWPTRPDVGRSTARGGWRQSPDSTWDWHSTTSLSGSTRHPLTRLDLRRRCRDDIVTAVVAAAAGAWSSVGNDTLTVFSLTVVGR